MYLYTRTEFARKALGGSADFKSKVLKVRLKKLLGELPITGKNKKIFYIICLYFTETL